MSKVLFIPRKPKVHSLAAINSQYSLSRSVVSSDVASLTIDIFYNKWLKRGTRIYKVCFYNTESASLFIGTNTSGVILFIDLKTTSLFKYPFETFEYTLVPGVGVFMKDELWTLKPSLCPIPAELKGDVIECFLEVSSKFSIPLSILTLP